MKTFDVASTRIHVGSSHGWSPPKLDLERKVAAFCHGLTAQNLLRLLCGATKRAARVVNAVVPLKSLNCGI